MNGGGVALMKEGIEISVYCTSDRPSLCGVERNAGGKARDDVLRALGDCTKTLEIEPSASADITRATRSIAAHFANAGAWNDGLSNLERGDVVVIQFPLTCHSVFAASVFKRYKKKGIRIVLLIHDLESIRMSRKQTTDRLQKLRIRLEELKALRLADVIIAHNERMKQWLVDSVGIPSDRIIKLGVFDYLANGCREESIRTRVAHFCGSPVVIAGNLSSAKASYLSQLPKSIPFVLYGAGLDLELPDNVQYMGSFTPSDGPNMLKGSFGLVWDGDSAETCSGVYGEYLRYNNPHKTSLYIASGLPVIIWDQAALAPYIKAKGLGILVPGLTGLADTLSSVSATEYSDMLINVAKESARLRAGMNTKEAVNRALELLGC